VGDVHPEDPPWILNLCLSPLVSGPTLTDPDCIPFGASTIEHYPRWSSVDQYPGRQLGRRGTFVMIVPFTAVVKIHCFPYRRVVEPSHGESLESPLFGFHPNRARSVIERVVCRFFCSNKARLTRGIFSSHFRMRPAPC